MKPAITPLFGILRSGLRSATRVSIVSAIATLLTLLTFVAQAQVTYNPVFSNTWVVPVLTYPDLTNYNSNVRGVAINPVNTNVLYASTANNTNGGAGHVSVLSFANGSNFLAQLNGTNVASGATVNLMNVRVADDGAVYACSRADAGGATFKIYRWVSDSDIITSPTVVFQGTAGVLIQGLGNHMDVRGSGINTEIVVIGAIASGTAVSTNAYVFRPTDATCATFTNFSFTIPGNTSSAIVSANGVTFEGVNNAIYVMDGSSPPKVRRVSYNPNTFSATVTRTNATDANTCRALKYYASTNGVEMLACVQYNTTVTSPQVARVFKLPASLTGSLVSVLSSNFPPPYSGSANANGVGQVDAKSGYFVFGAANCGLTFFQVDYTTTAPPSVNASSSASTIVQGYPVTFTATASGSTPLSYQWYFNTNTLIPGATTNVYSINSVQATNVGVYTLITTNLYGKATNSVSLSTVLPNGASAVTTNLWSLAPGSRTYLTTGDYQRGLGFDKNLNRVVLVTRSPTNGVLLLDGNTGADAGNLDISALLTTAPQGTYPINMCGVADDGIVYVGNLIISASSDNFVIYSWASADPSALISQAYAANPGGAVGWTGSIGRIGDSMAVRGSGINTEILCPFRNGTNVCIFTTTDGTTFTANIIAITNLVASIAGTDPFTGNSPLALGCAFGTGKTFWAKSANYNLRQVSYDLATGQGGVIGSYPLPGSEAPIGVDNSNGYVAAIGVNETPQNLAIYNLFAAGGPSLSSLLDREFFPADNSNGNSTGAVAVDAAGGRMFALDSNSGIKALTYAGTAFIAAGASQQVVTWGTSASTLQSTTNLAVPFADVVGAASPYTNTTDEVKFFRLKK